jgi:Leucine-rich repeat (LRR) protein
MLFQSSLQRTAFLLSLSVLLVYTIPGCSLDLEDSALVPVVQFNPSLKLTSLAASPVASRLKRNPARRRTPLALGLSEECQGLLELTLPVTVIDVNWLKLNHLKILNAANTGITSLRGLPKSLVELNVSNTQIESLGGIPSNLTSLDIQGTNIQSLKGLPRNLKALKLSHLAVEELNHLPLSLRELQLDDIKVQDFSFLPSGLEELSLTGVSFDSLSDLPPSLVALTLRGTRVSSLKAVLRPLSRLTRLGLSGNELRFNIGDLPDNLTEITIDQVSGPVDLSTLKYLGWLADFRDSDYVKLPASIFSLTLNATNLSGLPELPSLLALKLINAKFSPVKRLPVGFKELTLTSYRGADLGKLPSKLEKLILKSVGLPNLPAVPPGLEELRIIDTNIVDFNKAPGDLKTLVFCEGRVEKVGGIKQRFPKLRQLALCNSHMLKEVGDLPSGLKKLDISYTGIRQIPNLGSDLEELNISGTRIRLSSLSILPRKLKVLILSEGQVDSWEGFPPALQVLRFEGQ